MTVTAPLAGAVLLAAALTGGLFGGDAAKDFYQLLDDRDDNGQRDIVDKLSNLFFGATATITTPLPADLNGDKFTIDASLSRAEMVANAKTSIAWRYALRELNSFVITDVSYAAHNTDASLDLFDKNTGQGAMTEAYLADRAAMLAWKLQFEKKGTRDDNDAPRVGAKPYNEDWDTSTVQGNWDFIDMASTKPLQLAIDGAGISLFDHQVVFGSKTGDAIDGSGEADRLYGMAGNDTLDGMGGNDYLEGGSGEDTYQFTGAWGKDTVVDSDGLGAIQIDGKALGSAKGVGKANQWAYDMGAGVYAGMAVYDDPRSSTGKTFSIYLNQAARAGETITLALSGLADKFKAILGDSTVDANGAVITLTEGQTQVSFALVQDGDVTADASTSLSASYAGAGGSAVSNASRNGKWVATDLVAAFARQTGVEGRFGNEPTAICENSMSLVGQLQHKKWRIQLAAKEKTIRWRNATNEANIRSAA